jgi:hypothetical protein
MSNFEQARRDDLEYAWEDVWDMRSLIWDDEYDTEPFRGEERMREVLWSLMVGSHARPEVTDA